MFGGQQVLDQIINVTSQGARNVAATVADAVVSDTILREVVGPNFFGAIARADEAFTFVAELFLFIFDFLSQ